MTTKRSRGETRIQQNRNINNGNEAKRIYPVILRADGQDMAFQFTPNQMLVAYERAKKNPDNNPKHSRVKEIRDLLRRSAVLIALFIVASLSTGCSTAGLVRIMEPPLSKTDLPEMAANMSVEQGMFMRYNTRSTIADYSSDSSNSAVLTPAAMMDVMKFGAALGADAGKYKALSDAINKNREVDVTFAIAKSEDIRDMFIDQNKAKLAPGARIVEVKNKLVATAGVERIEVPAIIPAEPVTIPDILPPPTNTPAEEFPIEETLDAIDVRSAKLLGPHQNKGFARSPVTKLLTKAEIRNGLVYLEYEKLDWPSNNSGIGGNIDGRVFVFWKEGDQVYGGHFDWKRPDQTAKTLENIYGGYLGRQPPAGSDLYFAITANDMSERSNVLKANGTF